MSDISFEAACGASELGANAYIVQAYGCRLLLDAGADRNRLPQWVERVDSPDVCWLSHVHWDHLGGLGPLKARFPRLSCVTTATTRELAGFALSQGGVGDARASALASQLQSAPQRRYFELSRFSDNAGAEKFRAMVFPAGHIPGAGMLLVEIDTGQERPFRLIYTSDFCGHDQPAVPGALFPKTGQDYPVDVLVMEGVLATRKEYDDVSYADEWARFCETIAQRNNGALVAASTLGESAQVVAGLVEAGEQPVIHQMLEPVVGGHAQAESGDEAYCRRALGLGKVVVAPGEQLHRSTPAGRLRDGGEHGVAVLNRVHKKSPVGRLVKQGRAERFLLANHAPRRQLVGAVQAVNPAQVLLVHGHRSQLFSLKRAIAKAGYAGDIHVPKNHEALQLA